MTTTTNDPLQTLAMQGESYFGRREAQSGTPAYEDRVELSRAALRWAADTFGADLTVASSMGDEVLVHLVGTTIPGTDVFFLDTGYHFAETLETRDAYAALLPVTIRTILPRQSVAEQDEQFGPRLHDRSPDQCCAMRKVEPLERVLSDKRAWVTGMRREDAPTRTDIALVGWDTRRRMAKLNPIAAWTQDDVDRYVEEHDVFRNPLAAEWVHLHRLRPVHPCRCRR